MSKGLRVKVWNGDQSQFLGFGRYVDDVVTYAALMPDGSLRSSRNAEETIPADQLPEGAVQQELPKNPKIVLDNGQVVYGCQVWWESVPETVTVEEDNGYDPWVD